MRGFLVAAPKREQIWRKTGKTLDILPEISYNNFAVRVLETQKTADPMRFLRFLFFGGIDLTLAELYDDLEQCPVIASVHEELWQEALVSPATVVFYLKANLLTLRQHITQAHEAGKRVFVHLDLAEGIGKDKTGVEYLALCGADGLISTRGQLIKQAKEAGLRTVQRLFALDSQGISSLCELSQSASPDLIEIMPGVIGKLIARFAQGSVPIIAGGLIETKAEVTEALGLGAAAVSTGKKELWYL